MKDPNNVRNRWRRYRSARRAYGFTFLSFREWAAWGSANPKAYSAEPHHANFRVSLQRPRCPGCRAEGRWERVRLSGGMDYHQCLNCGWQSGARWPKARRQEVAR